MDEGGRTLSLESSTYPACQPPPESPATHSLVSLEPARARAARSRRAPGLQIKVPPGLNQIVRVAPQHALDATLLSSRAQLYFRQASHCYPMVCPACEK